MISGRYGPALRQIGRLLSTGSVASLGSSQLLERFAANRDEAAFEALIHQHGPMVLGTCRRMLADPHDVEDAFQATFLVLARRAGSIQDADRLGPWLHGVARRVASRSRALSARRNGLQRPIEGEASAEAPSTLEAAELRAALDEELASLPDKYRAPLVLCYLEGLTHDEAAARLRWPVGTVRSRLAGGRDRLRSRLTRRGLAPASSVPLVLARASIPQALLSTTVQVATSTGTIPATVATLAQGVFVAMIWNKLKLVGTLGLMTGLTVGGAGIATQQQGQGGQGNLTAAKPAPKASNDLAEGEGLEKEQVEKELVALTQRAKGELDLARLQGDWKCIRIQSDKYEAATLVPGTSLSIQGKTCTSTSGDGSVITVSQVVLGEEDGRKTIDFVHENQPDGKQAIDRGIYRLDGDTLEICEGSLNGPRPTEFKTSASGPFPMIITFEKQPDVARLKAAIQQLEKEVADQQATIKLWREQLNKQNPVSVERPSPKGGLVADEGELAAGTAGKSVAEAQADDPAFSKRLGELQEREEELRHRLKLLEIAGGKLSADYRPRMDPAKQKEALDDKLATISKLERELTSKTTEFGALESWTGYSRNQGTKRPVEPADPPQTPPVLVQLGEGWVVSIPSEQDRVTVLNTESGFRTTHRFPSKLTSIQPVWNGALAFLLTGPEVRQILAFSFGDKKWYPHDLKEPATKASPYVSPQEVSYELGRFFYIFSSQARKWSTLELKRGKVQHIPWIFDQQTGKRTYQEGTILRTYDPKTGEWTDVDTNGPDNGNTPAPQSPKASPATKPAPTGPKTGTKPPEPQASIYSLPGNPTLFSVFGPGRDRVTMINSETQERSTFRLAQPAEYVHPVTMGSGNFIALSINGKGITRTAVFDRLSSRWSEHDWYAPVAEIRPWPDPSTRFKVTPTHPLIGFTELAPEIRRLVVFDSSNGSWNEQELREPVKDMLKMAPTINETMAVYFIDRFVYIYSSPAKKWSVLEGKQKIWPVSWMQEIVDSSGRMAFQEADVIHLYDPKTGDWTHIDTKDDK